MAHEIFGERFLGRKTAAWHRLGQVIPQDRKLLAAAAVLVSGCAYEVHKYPLTYQIPGHVDDGHGNLVPGMLTQPSGQVAIVRNPTADQGSYHLLGTASEGYSIVQNMAIGFLLDELSKEWPVETVGALNNGETMFMTLKIGDASINSDELSNYLFIANHHNGKSAIKIGVTPVRIVCQNTLTLGLSQAAITVSIPHTSDVEHTLEFRLKLLASVQKQKDKMYEDFQRMADTRATDAVVDEILLAAYPDPKPSRRKLLADVVTTDDTLRSILMDSAEAVDMKQFDSDLRQHAALMEAARKVRAVAKARYESTGDLAPQIGGTIWAAWQGVTEVENYRGKDDVAASTSILFGDRARVMARSFKRAMEFVG